MGKTKQKQIDIEKLVELQRCYFHTGQTRSIKFRLWALEQLKNEIIMMEDEICQALQKDLGKSATESYMTEIGMVLSEIRHMQKYLKLYAAKTYVMTPLAQFPATSYKVAEPYGVVLVMSPWNYPFMLAMEPVVDAIAAGNTVVIKPGNAAPKTSEVIKKLVEACFKKQYVAVVIGDRVVNQKLLDQKFDYIFFTGGKKVGRFVMEKAAAHLTPVTLELGGKSPCIVDSSADIRMAAHRIVFGKFLNEGQTCVAPDYVLVHQSVKRPLIKAICKEIDRQYGNAYFENAEYPHMINEVHFNRVMNLLKGAHIIKGGKCNQSLKIEPTVVDGITMKHPLMQEEIFGPVLPILTYKTREEAVQMIRQNETPLALYLFTSSSTSKKYFLKNVRFGGGCINDTIIHLATSYMGFGGTGQSGMGSYHGKAGFDTFTHRKSIVDKKTWLDLPLRYHPYNRLKDKIIRKFM